MQYAIIEKIFCDIARTRISRLGKSNMTLNNIGGFKTIEEYILAKIAKFEKEDKNCSTLFKFMFSEKQNVFAEISDGYKIRKITYGEAYERVFRLAPYIKNSVNAQKGSLVGIYMQNSAEWIEIFWAILSCGFKPLLMNTRMSKQVLQDVLDEYDVKAVISDGEKFNSPTFYLSDIVNSSLDTQFAPDWEDDIVFMSSGTTGDIKLCYYNGENFFYQIKNSADIVRACPKIATHYQGELKQLALLPFYHVFGFIAVYIWFGFFSRTFVFLKDLNPNTLLSTIKRHKVTHIFAVPLVWEAICEKAIKTIKGRGEKTYKKFLKGLKIANRSNFGRKITHSAFKEVRDGLFGESVSFLISGGSAIDKKALEFFNAIGYHITNGYGMTEVGITSVETCDSHKILNTASVGSPLLLIDYKINDKGELLIKGKTRANKIVCGKNVILTDYEEYFNSKDVVKCVDGRYYINGRSDDLIVCENGENLNPEILESQMKIDGADKFALFADKNGTPTLIVSAPACYSENAFIEIKERAIEQIKNLKLLSSVKNVVITTDSLIEGNDFKLSRKKVAKKYDGGGFYIVDINKLDEAVNRKITALESEIIDIFAQTLKKSPQEIATNADFFTDLGGSSFDYFALIDTIKVKYGVPMPLEDGKTLSTVDQFCSYLKNR